MSISRLLIRLKKSNYVVFIIFISFSLFSISVTQISLTIGIVISLIIFFLSLKLSGESFIFSFKQKWREISFVIIPYLLYCFGAILGVVFTPEYKADWFSLKELLLFVVFPWSYFILKDKQNIDRFIKHYAWVLIPFMLLGILQSFTGYHFSKTPRAWYRMVLLLQNHTSLDLWDSMYQAFYSFSPYLVKKLQDTKSIYHVSGFLGHHLTYSGYLIFPLFLYGSKILFFPGKSNFFENIKQNKQNFIFTFVIFLLVLLNLFMSQARSVMLASFLTATILLFYRKKALLILLVFFVLLSALFVHQWNHEVYRRFTSKALDIKSNSERIFMWKTALKYFREYPLTGIGSGTYVEYYKKDRAIRKKELKQMKPEDRKEQFSKHIYEHPHNEFLNQLIMGGILRFLGFIGFLFLPFVFFYRYRKKNKSNKVKDNYLLWSGFAFLLAFILASLFQSFFSDDEDQTIFWVALALFYAVYYHLNSNNFRSSLKKELKEAES